MSIPLTGKQEDNLRAEARIDLVINCLHQRQKSKNLAQAVQLITDPRLFNSLSKTLLQESDHRNAFILTNSH